MPSRIPAASIRQYVTYLPCSSVAVLTLTTLIVDLVGPLLGVHEPLRRLPLLVGLNLALPGLAFLGRGAGPSYELYSSDLMDRMPWLWPLLLPLLAVVAAMRLDNGAGNTLAVVILIASAAIICVGTVRANRLDSRQITLLLYGCGLSLMLLTSIRSAYVIGFDINSEYFDFHQTVVTGIWHFGHLNPYEAMLSLTVFPASLHSLIGGQDVWIFKLGYPALFAFFPVAVFELGTRFLSRRESFVAAAIIISQSYFFQQQPEIARQELALLLFAGVFGALLDPSLRRGLQVRLACVLGITLVVSHYSTTYVTVFLCVLASIVARVVSSGRKERLPVLPWLIAAAVMSVSALVWYLPLTHSTSNVTAAAQSIHQSGIQLLPGRRKGENIFSAYFNGLREASSTPAQYQSSIASYYSKHLGFIAPLTAARDPAYNLRGASPPKLPVRSRALASGLSDAELVAQQILNALAVLGALVFALRRRGHPFSNILGALGIASLFVLAASRLSGAFATDYNSSRLYLQCLFVLALVEVALIEVVARRLRLLRRPSLALFGAFSLILVIAFVGNSGLANPIVGGDPPLILYNKGEDYADFYPSAQEETTAQWLAAVVPRNRLIFADYYAQLRLDQFTNLRFAVFDAVTPRTIDRHGWVYASTANIVGHLSWGVTNSGVIDIAFPASFLDKYFDVVYSTGTTDVFHR